MTLIKNKWFRVLLTYIGCSLCWIAFNIAYNTTSLSVINQLDEIYSMALKIVWYVILYVLSYWCLKPFKFSRYTILIISCFVSMALYLLCGLAVLISHVIMGYSL